MTILQYLSAFRLFGGDVLVLGLAVTIIVSVLKKTVLKNASKKLFVFAPFVLGTLLFAAYRCLAELSAAPLTSDAAATFEGGFACGCAATLYYVVYEQFLRVKQSAGGADTVPAETAHAAGNADMVPTDSADARTLAALLEPFISAGAAKNAAADILAGRAELAREAFAAFVRETLARYMPTAREEERAALAAAIAGAAGG